MSHYSTVHIRSYWEQHLKVTHNLSADPSGRAVQGVGLRPLAYWDCGFESHWRHECLSLVSVVCCQLKVSAAGWSLIQRSPTEYGTMHLWSRNLLVSQRVCSGFGRSATASVWYRRIHSLQYLISVRMSDIGCSEVYIFPQHTVPELLSGDKIP